MPVNISREQDSDRPIVNLMMTMQTYRRVIIFGVSTVLVIGILLLISRSRSVIPKRPSRSSPATVSDSNELISGKAIPESHAGGRFTGSQRCAQCHAEIADAYQHHPMANSVSPARSLPAGAEHASPIVPGHTHDYDIYVNDDRIVHRNRMSDVSGELIYSQEFAMDYVIGSGRRAFAYLRQEGELLFQSPLNWYSRESKWDLAPGYRIDDERRFRRRITDDCLSCHAGLVARVTNMPSRYATTPLIEFSIGCERCHGPGEAHVNYHETSGSGSTRIEADGSAGAEIPHGDLSGDPMLSLSRSGTAERESLCNQCHLQSAARVLRPGRSEFDFRPGMTISDIWSVLDAGTDAGPDGRMRAVSHVQQMRDSLCYIRSEGAVGCVSCHDPHRIPLPEERLSFYRDRCQACHQADSCAEVKTQRDLVSDSCIECHMPRRESSNVAHVTQTDHRIVRTPIGSVMSGDEEELPGDGMSQPLPAEVRMELRFFDNGHLSLSAWERNRALGVGLWSYLMRKGKSIPPQIGAMLESVLREQPDDGLTLATMGALAMFLQRAELAEGYWERALNHPESREAALSGLLDIRYRQANWISAMELVDECLMLDPGHPGFHAIRADCLFNSGRVDEAIAAGRKSLELGPTQTHVLEWMIAVCERSGYSDDAVILTRRLQRMQEKIALKAERATITVPEEEVDLNQETP